MNAKKTASRSPARKTRRPATRRSRGTTAKQAESAALALSLPPQSRPVARKISTAPFRIAISAAGQRACDACWRKCAALPWPQRIGCEAVCVRICSMG